MAEMRLAVAPGVELHARIAGSGPPLLLLHGWCLSAAVWQEQQRLLAERWQTIAVDLRGHGASTAAADGYDLPQLAADIAVLMERLGLVRPVVAGWSLGGMVALQLAARGGASVAGLVLVGSTPRFTVADDFPAGLPVDQPRGMAAKVRRDYRRCLDGFFTGMFAADELPADGAAQLATAVRLQEALPPQEVALATLTTLATVDLRPELANIACPALVLHGSADRVCLPAAGEFLARHLANGQLALLPELGHATFLSRPAEFAARLIPFLESCHERH